MLTYSGTQLGRKTRALYIKIGNKFKNSLKISQNFIINAGMLSNTTDFEKSWALDGLGKSESERCGEVKESEECGVELYIYIKNNHQ